MVGTMRKTTIFTLALFAALCIFAAMAPKAQAQAANGTTLSAPDLTPQAHYTRTFDWTIDKSVTPATWDLFRGDSGTSEYTISVTKDNGTAEAYLDGRVCVNNGGAVATENLAINANLTKPPSQTVLASSPVSVSGNPVLSPGETGCYDYRVDIPAASVQGGATYKVTTDITITNHSGHLGTPFGPNPSGTASLPASPTLVNDSVNVDDTNGQSFPFSASGSESYNETFNCNTDEGVNKNTATIRETDQSDSASVTVNCYSLDVSKDANTSFTRTYDWTIDKSADQSELTLAIGQQFLVNYAVKVDAASTDSAHEVSGAITIDNPAPVAASLTSVSDVVSPAIAASVDCPSLNVPAGGSLSCTYSANLPNDSSRTNTATATLQNNSYDSAGNATASGTTDFSGSANVSFANASVNRVDESIDVSDSLQGPLGTVTAGEAPKTFSYGRNIGPFATSGDRTVDNTASFVTNDTGATGSDSWSVLVHVPGGGCTLTIGYWKTHADPTSNRTNPNATGELLPILLGTSGGARSVNVTTTTQAVNLLNFSSDASNGINKLYAQLLAAKLNIKNGAGGSAVSGTISAADSFLANNNAANWAGLSKAQKTTVLGWATTLDNYNNGLTGPGHCSQ